MQIVSDAYKQSMKGIGRNRGYIKVSIGIVNSEAQKSAYVDSEHEEYSNLTSPFLGKSADKLYATTEENFSSLDGKMYFLPQGSNYYDNGVVSKSLLGAIKVSFPKAFDLTGLTIDFSDSYPTDFTISNGKQTRSYTDNSERYFSTSDSFNGSEYILISPTQMVNGQTRLRILGFTCGIANTFTNENLERYSSQEYVSPIAETLPSSDVSITIFDYDQNYAPDNPDSELNYMEVGQEVLVSFGYDVFGDGNIEWLPETKTFLKSWSADDETATFQSTDIFNFLDSTYYKGVYKASGWTLYDMAVDVLNDANIDPSEYFLDSYLKKVRVYNPLPVCKHTEALQIIANAGRCTLSQDRKGRIHITSGFVPDISATSSDATEFSNPALVTQNENQNVFYALASNDFTLLSDENLLFKSNERNNGFVSKAVSGSNCLFNSNPKITVNLESTYTSFGFGMRFRNTFPTRFKVYIYSGDSLVQMFEFDNDNTTFSTTKQFDEFDKMIVEFVQTAKEGQRIFVDKIYFGEESDYVIYRDKDMKGSPRINLEDKIHSILVDKYTYSESQEIKTLASNSLILTGSEVITNVLFSNASYDLESSISSGTIEILESSNYYAKIKIRGTKGAEVKYEIKGKEYFVTTKPYEVVHNDKGIVKEWKNPLISNDEMAERVESWIASYMLSDLSYEIPWRGDPRCDANDLFFLETKRGDILPVRAYENVLNFDGGWSGTLKLGRVIK